MSRYVLVYPKSQNILNEGGQMNLDVGYVMLDIIPIFFVSAIPFDCNLHVFSFAFCLGHLAELDHGSSGPVKGERNFGY